MVLGGFRPPQPRTAQPPSSHRPALCAHRTNGDLEIIFIAKQKQIYLHRNYLFFYCFVESLTEEVEEETEEDFVRENLLTAFL